VSEALIRGVAAMSGPIVRKYGFPNFEKIFGERPLEHGADEDESSDDQPEKARSSESTKKRTDETKNREPKQK
jgi:hypothetical protein